jgi:hypothetical protein
MRWLADALERSPELQLDNLPGEACQGTTSRRLRAILAGDTSRISERVVERIGIAIDRNPRLAAELYPELAEPVCARCQRATCQHIGRADIAEQSA